jgi:hypothetical protein
VSLFVYKSIIWAGYLLFRKIKVKKFGTLKSFFSFKQLKKLIAILLKKNKIFSKLFL